jgi:hypothetical protein
MNARVHSVGFRAKPARLAAGLIIPALCVVRPLVLPATGLAQSPVDLDCRERFTPNLPALILKYEVTYRLFRLNLMHLADAVVSAADGEWFNEASGEWLPAYFLTFSLDTLEDPSESGRSRYAIHNRLSTVLIKPTLKPLFFAKRDLMRVDTFYNKVSINNMEIFSVEAGKYDYVKNDFIARAVITNMPHFAKLIEQRGEVFRFMKAISAAYAGDTNGLADLDNFTLSIFTDNAFVPFAVDVAPQLRKLEALDKKYKALRFNAVPAPGFSGRGRVLSAWVAPFRYVAEMENDAELRWLANETFEMGMIPLRAEYGLKLGTVRCELVAIGLKRQ